MPHSQRSAACIDRSERIESERRTPQSGADTLAPAADEHREKREPLDERRQRCV